MPGRPGRGGESARQRPATYSSSTGTDRTAIRFTTPATRPARRGTYGIGQTGPAAHAAAPAWVTAASTLGENSGQTLTVAALGTPAGPFFDTGPGGEARDRLRAGLSLATAGAGGLAGLTHGARRAGRQRRGQPVQRRCACSMQRRCFLARPGKGGAPSRLVFVERCTSPSKAGQVRPKSRRAILAR